MDTTYRLRFLIYFAVFMLFMSLCFVYAEPLPSQPSGTSHLLFQTPPQHDGFLAPLASEPTFDPAALHVAVVPTISPAMLEHLENRAHPHRSLFHQSRHNAAHLVPVNTPSESSILELTLQPRPHIAP